jgi:hypothetical protein
MYLFRTLIRFLFGALLIAGAVFPYHSSAQQPAPDCLPKGWAVEGGRLKDHTVFTHDGWYYLVSTYISLGHYEDRFAYARSTDLCNWENLGPILTERIRWTWDEFAVWAPFVLEEEGVYYMFYTGVTEEVTQSIMLATSTDPADPTSWQVRGMVFQPSHLGMVWPGAGRWSDARDPHVVKADGRYYLYYTGRDRDGGIVGVATATSLRGPWQDWGATLKVSGAMLESPGVFERDDTYYLVYNRVLDGIGPEVRVGPTPGGPWSAPRLLRPGWAHEFWLALDGNWMTSYLTDYTVTVQPVAWDTIASPSWPFIGEELSHVWLPAVMIPNPPR